MGSGGGHASPSRHREVRPLPNGRGSEPSRHGRAWLGPERWWRRGALSGLLAPNGRAGAELLVARAIVSRMHRPAALASAWEIDPAAEMPFNLS